MRTKRLEKLKLAVQKLGYDHTTVIDGTPYIATGSDLSYPTTIEEGTAPCNASLVPFDIENDLELLKQCEDYLLGWGWKLHQKPSGEFVWTELKGRETATGHTRAEAALHAMG